jgi:hypothetical protein
MIMRVRFPLLLALGLAGCAGPLPAPAPDMAWVDLSASGIDTFMSDRLDGQRTPDGRFFQVSPGAHELEARYEFEISSGGFGDFGETNYLRCTMVIRYDDFQAGQRYLFQARSLGFTPQGWLRDAKGTVVARAEAEHCY